MSAHFDDILSKKIGQTFEQLEVSYDPTGWQLLQQRIPASASNNGSSLSIIPKIAAVLIVSIGVGHLVFEFTNNNIGLNEASRLGIAQDIPAPTEEKHLESDNGVAEETESLIIQKPEKSRSFTVAKKDAGVETEVHTVTEQKAHKDNAIISTREVNPLNLALAIPGTTLRPQQAIHFADDPVITKDMLSSDPIDTDFKVFASSLVNYGEAEESSPVSFGAGFASSLAIGNGFSLSSGLILAQQNVGIQNIGSINAESSNGATEINTSADLFTIDIPMNIRYHLPSQGGRKTYISAGLSSFLYLKEDFVQTTRQLDQFQSLDEEGNLQVTNVIRETQSTTSGKALSRVDFARVFNLSFGYHYQLSDKLNLVFEPYIKYPIGSLTSRNVQFGSGGVHVKIGFR